MAKVYIVTGCIDYEGCIILEVHTDKAKADSAREEYETNRYDYMYDTFHVDEHNLIE